jgi:NAD(P)-dependent dehydrogenase (short-subunit alcohol dehydrogenase family)
MVGGRLINTTSGAGLLGNFGQSNYATAKAALVGLSLTLSVELANIGVTVNVISPGGKTRITGTMPEDRGPGGTVEETPDVFDPLDPTMASPVVAYLCSDRASHISGQVIRAFGEDIRLLQGWTPVATVDCGGKRWDANEMAGIFDKQIFHSRAPGLTF